MANLKNTTIDDTGFLELPAGTSAQRPASPQAGMTRYNTDSKVKEMYNGSIWIPLSPFPYVSASSASSLGFNDSGPGDVVGESDALSGGCSAKINFEAALDFVTARNCRLPTITEISQDVARGTGCGFDSDFIWTINSVSVEGDLHYVVLGDLTDPPPGEQPIPYLNTSIAYVRYVADADVNRSDPVMLNDHFVYNYLYG